MHKPNNPANEPPLDLLVELGYETRDVAFRTIFLWIGALFAFTIVTCTAVLLAFRWFVPDVNQAQDVVSNPLGYQRQLPSSPQIQAEPKREMELYHAGEDAQINGYTWANDQKTQVNIPVDKAIDMLAARGISGIKGTTTRTVGQLYPAYPGSGDYKARRANTDESESEMSSPRRSGTSAKQLPNSHGTQLEGETVPNDGKNNAPAANTDNQQYRTIYGSER